MTRRVVPHEHALLVGGRRSGTVCRSRKVDVRTSAARIMPADPSRESGTRARVDGRSSDCRRSERRRTADRWWVESESTDLPDSCEPTKRALSSPVLSCSARSLRLDAFSPVGVPRPKSHPTQSVRPWYRLGTHVLARPPSCSDFYASTAARPTELGLARLCALLNFVLLWRPAFPC